MNGEGLPDEPGQLGEPEDQDHHQDPDRGSAAPFPYFDAPAPRPMLDPARPWLEAGRSWDAESDRVATYFDKQRGRPRRFYDRVEPKVVALRRRAEACRDRARELGPLTARGWVVWHDRLAPGTCNVVDHVLIGTGGVVLLQSVPVLDTRPSTELGTVPGPTTANLINTGWNVLSTQIVESVAAAIGAALPSWSVPIRGHQVLVGKAISSTFTDILRPFQVEAFVAAQGSIFAPMHVHDLAFELERLFVPVPLH